MAQWGQGSSDPRSASFNMLGNFLKRWTRGAGREQPVRRGDAPASPAPADTLPRNAAVPAAPLDPPAVSIATPDIPCWRLVRRRPVLGHNGAIVGWDLELPPERAQRVARPGAPKAVRAAHQQALLHSARSLAQSEQLVVLAPPATAIVELEFLDALPKQAILRLGREHDDLFRHRLPSVVDGLVRRGLCIATDKNLPHTIGLVDGSQFTDRASLLEAANALSPLRSARLAVNIFSFEDVSALIELGFTYCCGAFQKQAQRSQRSQLSAPIVGAAAALAAVVAGKPVDEVARLVKADVTLSYRLLRTVNSAAFGLTRPAESIRDALMLLGSRELYRWLTMLLMSAEADRPLAPALIETALVRARLCELLASERGTEPPEALFVTGAFSLLDVLLDVPLEVPLASARLPDATVEALISASGPWRPHIDAALAIESADADAIAKESGRLGLTPDRLFSLAEDAAAWAHEAAATLGDARRTSAPQAAAEPLAHAG